MRSEFLVSRKDKRIYVLRNDINVLWDIYSSGDPTELRYACLQN